MEQKKSSVVIRSTGDEMPSWLRGTAKVVLIPVAGALGNHVGECVPVQTYGFYACSPAVRHPDHVEQSTANGSLGGVIGARAPIAVTTSTSVGPQTAIAITTTVEPVT